MSVTVPCTFSDATYRVLAGIAASKGTQVHRLIEAQTERALLAAGGIPVPEPPVRRAPTVPRVCRPVTDDDKLSWMHMWLGGMSDTEIAKTTGRPQPTVSRTLRILGCPPRKPAGKATTIEEEAA